MRLSYHGSSVLSGALVPTLTKIRISLIALTILPPVMMTITTETRTVDRRIWGPSVIEQPIDLRRSLSGQNGMTPTPKPARFVFATLPHISLHLVQQLYRALLFRPSWRKRKTVEVARTTTSSSRIRRSIRHGRRRATTHQLALANE